MVRRTVQKYSYGVDIAYNAADTEYRPVSARLTEENGMRRASVFFFDDVELSPAGARQLAQELDTAAADAALWISDGILPTD